MEENIIYLVYFNDNNLRYVSSKRLIQDRAEGEGAKMQMNSIIKHNIVRLSNILLVS